MSKAAPTTLERQLARVHRRLLTQRLVNTLASFWCAALVIGVAWLLLQPFVLPTPPDWHRWGIVGGIVALSTIGAIAYGIWNAPSWLAAALSLDSEFQLRERVTTSLTLDPALQNTPAAKALFADVNDKLQKLDVGEKFPIRLRWQAGLVPVFAGILALVALFYRPILNQATAKTGDDGQEPPVNAAEVQQKVKELQKKVKEKPDADKAKTEDLKALEAELEKIANRPFDNKEQVRERLKEMTSLEEQMKQMEKSMAEKSQALKQQLQRLDASSQRSNEGPMKELSKALSEGKMDKARDEIEKLSKKIQANQLTEKEKEQLKKQLDDLQNKLERAANQKDKEDALKQMNLDPETLKRELDALKQDSEKLKSLQQMAKDLQKAQQALKENDMQALKNSLDAAADDMKKMQGDDQDLEELREQLKSLQDAKDGVGQGMSENEKQDPQDQELLEDSDNAGQGAGKRPLGKPGAFKSYDTKPKTEFDPKGRKIFDGFAPGEAFKSKSRAELVGEVRQASQEAPEATEAQRIPKSAKSMAKGFWQKMREQTEKQEGTPK